eukprot:XP_001693538.1 predicted protein [Chlamydomonas reinhardtii]
MTPYLVCLLILGLLATAASGSDSASCVECHQGSAAAGQASLDTASLVGDAPALDASRFVVTALDPVASRRQLLQAHSREALVKVRTLLSEQLKMPAVDSASMRRRRLLSPAKPVYSTQCLYEEPPPPEDSGDAAGDAPPPDAPPSAPPPDTPTTSTDNAESPTEIMLMRTAFWSYQCMFENKKRRCGTYLHPPYDCRWNELQERCMVGPDFLIPRFVEFLHCRDDATITPFWHRCYMIQVLTEDSSNCGQPDGDWARCWFFPARDDVEGEVDTCGPDEAGGVPDRDTYDSLVASMRNGTWERDWYGECPTADLVYTLASACPYPAGDQGDADCAADPSCVLTPSRPTEYGRCRLKDDLLWDAIFGAGSELFNMTNAAMAECAAASGSYDACMAAGSLAPEPGAAVPIDDSKFPDPNLTFIEEITDGAAGPGLRAGGLLLAVLLAASLALMQGVLIGDGWAR